MKKGTALAIYAAAAILCVAGILTAVVNDIWKGRQPYDNPQASPGATLIPRQIGMQLSPSSGSTEGVITAASSIFWVTEYKKCAHQKVSEKSPEQDTIGLTYQQFANRYPGYALVVSSAVLRMEHAVDQYCPDHYVIKSQDDGAIFVYRNLDGEDKLTVVSKLGLTMASVPDDYKQYIVDGIAFGSVEEIEGFIENAET